MTEKTTKSYILELTEEEAYALQNIVGVFWPGGIAGNICTALDEALGEPKDTAAVLYEGSCFDNKLVETDMTYVLNEHKLQDMMNG